MTRILRTRFSLPFLLNIPAPLVPRRRAGGPRGCPGRLASLRHGHAALLLSPTLAWLLLPKTPLLPPTPTPPDDATPAPHHHPTRDEPALHTGWTRPPPSRTTSFTTPSAPRPSDERAGTAVGLFTGPGWDLRTLCPPASTAQPAQPCNKDARGTIAWHGLDNCRCALLAAPCGLGWLR